MLVFQNPGLIDIAAVTTMGVSVKEGDSPIGYFGTGLKFAIATILREGGEITICRGREQFEFTAESLTVRGQDFQRVCMNKEPLGFTTQLGRNWEPWMAFRELASNCRDEAGRFFLASAEPWSMLPEYTTIVVEGGKVEDAYGERGDILLETQPIYSTETVDIHEGPSEFVFYRGVRIHKPFRPTAMRYNIKRAIDLTEDRTAKYSFEVHDRIVRGVSEVASDTLLRKVLTCGEAFLEHHLDFATMAAPTEQFTRIGNQLAMGREAISTANPTVVASARRRSLDTIQPGQGMALDRREDTMLERAAKMLAAAHFDINAFPLICVETLGPGVHGMALDGKIFVSRLAFEKGTRELAATLLEEYAHLRSGQGDCTRGFQNWLFDQLLIKIEIEAGEPF